MRLDIAVVGLTFDTEAGTFSAKVGVTQIVREGLPAAMYVGGRVVAEAHALTHSEAIGEAIKLALRDPVFHKDAA